MADCDITPDFIYGGPFLCKANYPKPFIDTIAPINVQLQGIFRKSLAYDTMRERVPVLLTKIIDQLSRDEGITKQTGASKDNLKTAIENLSELKNEIVTNKKMALFKEESEDSEEWNKWVQDQDDPYYYTAKFIFAECYIYRRIKESFEHIEKLNNFDPFRVQKENGFNQNLEAICQVADRVTQMAEGEDEKEIKNHLVWLMKLCLWANKCDLSLTVGEEAEKIVDPFTVIDKSKAFVLKDDSAKIAAFIIKRSKALNAQLEKKPPPKAICECENIAKDLGWIEDKAQPAEPPAEGAEEKKFDPSELTDSCLATAKAPDKVIIDYVCDNAGYELFSDLCLGHYLVARGLVHKVRFHLKDMPWFVSDVTRKDFNWVINQCMGASFFKAPPEPEKKEGEEPKEDEPPKPEIPPLTSDNLKKLGASFQEHVQSGKFEIHVDDYWTQPHVYREMKTRDEYLYRKLQFGIMIFFKGDLNYRKLLGDKNWLCSTTMPVALEGFHPAPIASIRTVKSEVICGVPIPKWTALMKQDDQWMRKGNYGLIQICYQRDHKLLKLTNEKLRRSESNNSKDRS